MNIDKLASVRAVVHCSSKEDANAFLSECDAAGYTWQNGDNLRSNTCWEHFGKETCYHFSGGETISYADKPFYVAAGFPVVAYTGYRFENSVKGF